MSDPLRPTNPEWVLFDPIDKDSPDYREPPSSGEDLLLVSEGGILNTGPWRPGALAWGYRPKLPPSVKARISAAMKRRLERP